VPKIIAGIVSHHLSGIKKCIVTERVLIKNKPV